MLKNTKYKSQSNIIRILLTKLILFISIVFSNPIFAQTSNYFVEHKYYTKLDGLPSKEITCGLQDKYGYLWFGTKNGLCRFDGKHFEYYGKNQGLRGVQIYSLFFDDSLGVVISYSKPNTTSIELNQKDVINIKTLIALPFNTYYKNSLFKENEIVRISQLPNTSKILIELNKHNFDKPFQKIGKQCYLIHKGILTKDVFQLSYFVYTNKQGKSIKSTVLTEDSANFHLIVFKNGTFYINSNTKGNLFKANDSSLIYIDKNTTLYVNKHQLQTTSYSNITQQLINIADTAELYGTTNNSFLAITKSNKTFFVNQQAEVIDITSKYGNLTDPSVNFTFFDRQHNFWICTDFGLLKTTMNKNNFEICLPHILPTDKINSIRGIYVSSTQTIICSQDKIFVQNYNMSFTIPETKNFSICKTDSLIWIGNFNINTLNLKTQRLEKKIQIDNEVWCLKAFSKNQLLVGTTYNAFIYTISTNKLTQIKTRQFPKPNLIYNYFKNSFNQWCMVADNGFYTLNSHATDVVDYYGALSNIKTKQFPFEGITAIIENSVDTYWIITANEGLFLWNKTSNTFKQFGYEAGFLSLTCFAMQKDDDGNLWIGTDLGLAFFNIKTQYATFYTKQNGLQEEEFNRIASYKDTNGQLYFGGINGITTFKSKEFNNKTENYNLPFLLKKITVFNANSSIEENLTNTFNTTKKIEVNDYQKKLTIDFMYLDNSSTNNKTTNYAYQLKGFDHTWQYTTNTSIIFNSLPYGHYQLQIKAQTNNGSWNKQIINIPIYVLKPFYKQIWFSISLFIFALLSVALWFWYRIRREKKENLRLENLVDGRTHELKLSLQEQTALMQELHHRVKNNLQFITAMLKLQIKSTTNAEHQIVLENTSRRINAITLVHDMLYNKEKLERVSLKDYLNELVNKLNELVNTNSTKIEITLDVDELYFNINNCVAIGMMTSELINNAIKYAFDNTINPQIHISLKLNSNTNILQLIIQDNGIGIDNTKKATGLGMRLIDIFARQMKATYTFKKQNGTLFTCQIPYKKI